jgi:hypothetical protein
MKSPIVQSAEESALFGINIARCNHLNFSKDELYQSIITHSTDLVRLHLDSINPEVFNQLEYFNFPYALQYVAVRCSMDLVKEQLQIKRSSTIQYEFIEYDSSMHYETLYQLAKVCMSDVENASYHYAYLSAYIPPNMLTEIRAKYACTFDNKLHKNKIGFLGKEQSTGKIIIFFALEIISEELVIAYLGGVHPDYRMHGVGSDGYLKIIQEFLIPKGFKKFGADIQIQNIGSIRTAGIGGKGLSPSESFLRINLFPFFNSSRIDNISGQTDNLPVLIAQTATLLKLDKKYAFSSVRHVKIQDAANGIYTYTLSLPVLSEQTALAVLKIFNNNQLVSVYYVSYQAPHPPKGALTNINNKD